MKNTESELIGKNYERTGAKFNLDIFLHAREMCISATHKIISEIQPGMNEKHIKDLVDRHFSKIGVTKFWHPTKIRIQSDTMKSFRELSDPHLKCAIGDICFLDLGPVIQEHEADYGKTFLVGKSETNSLIQTCHAIFDSCAQKWKLERLSGKKLFEYANELANKQGYKLNPMMSGHRLGDFPHKLFSSEKLFEIESVPTKNLWVLEIHIIDESKNTGAFFEDILL